MPSLYILTISYGPTPRTKDILTLIQLLRIVPQLSHPPINPQRPWSLICKIHNAPPVFYVPRLCNPHSPPPPPQLAAAALNLSQTSRILSNGAAPPNPAPWTPANVVVNRWSCTSHHSQFRTRLLAPGKFRAAPLQQAVRKADVSDSVELECCNMVVSRCTKYVVCMLENLEMRCGVSGGRCLFFWG
jgi:hypothetical protein